MAFKSGNVAGGNVATLNLAWPTGAGAPASGDVAVLVYAFGGTLTSAPTGFTQIGSVGGSNSLTCTAYRRVCDGTETGNISMSNAGTNRQSATLVIYPGIDGTTPIDVIASRVETTAGTTHAAPSVTVPSGGDVILTAVAERANSGTNNWTAGSGYLEREDTTTLATGTGGTSTAIAEENPFVNHAGGATVTPSSWTSGNSFSTANVVTWTIALNAATVAGTGSISLGGGATAGASATSTAGSITLGGSVAAKAPATAGGTVDLGGTATPTSTSPAARGSVDLGADLEPAAGAVVAGSITLNALAVAQVAALGAITLGGSITAQAAATSAGSITLGSLVAVGQSTIVFWCFGQATIRALSAPAPGIRGTGGIPTIRTLVGVLEGTC